LVETLPDFDSGKQLSWLGLVLAAIGAAFSGLWRKKRDDE
jgi:LPXTG-motif cell wall-anchored protein